MNFKLTTVLLSVLCIQLFAAGCKKKDTETATPTDTTMVYVAANDPLIQYTGRIDFSNVLKPEYSWPGVSIKAKFQGPAIDIVIKDYGTGSAANTNYYNIIIDGTVENVVQVNNTDTIYPAARKLSDGTHTIEVFRRTEAAVAKSSFHGFQLRKGKKLLTLPAKPSRKVEFIGDSFTAGYGNDISYSSGTNSGFHSVYENNYTAWGAIVCRTFNAQYHCTAYSGRGLYRNNTGSTTGTIPSVYTRIHPDATSPTWSPSDYIPDLVVIHIGTNDFAPEAWGSPSMVDSTTFVNTYISFLTTLRGYYPSAEIICVVPNSMTDWYPVGFQSLTRIKNYVDAAVDTRNTAGDGNVHYFLLTPQTAPYGEDWHPSNPTHQSMANQISPFIQTVMGW